MHNRCVLVCPTVSRGSAHPAVSRSPCPVSRIASRRTGRPLISTIPAHFYRGQWYGRCTVAPVGRVARRRRRQQITSCVPVLRRFHDNGWVARHLYDVLCRQLRDSSTGAERTCARSGDPSGDPGGTRARPSSDDAHSVKCPYVNRRPLSVPDMQIGRVDGTIDGGLSSVQCGREDRGGGMETMITAEPQ